MIPIKDRTHRTGFPLITVGLIVLNCLFFALELGTGLDRAAAAYGAVPWFVTHPGRDVAVRSVPVLQRTLFGYVEGEELIEVFRPRPGALGSLFTSMFLHGDLFHLIFNMLFLWVFGDNIEDRLGKIRFLLFYLTCGVGAALAHIVFNPDSLVPMIGASGAISGVMGAYVLLFPRNRVVAILPIFFFIQLVELPAYVYLGIWFLIQLLSVGSGSGVAFLAHIGGFALGFVLIRLFDRRGVPPAGFANYL